MDLCPCKIRIDTRVKIRIHIRIHTRIHIRIHIRVQYSNVGTSLCLPSFCFSLRLLHLLPGRDLAGDGAFMRLGLGVGFGLGVVLVFGFISHQPVSLVYEQAMTGFQDEFRIWSTVRTEDQIRANYKRSIDIVSMQSRRPATHSHTCVLGRAYGRACVSVGKKARRD